LAEFLIYLSDDDGHSVGNHLNQVAQTSI